MECVHTNYNVRTHIQIARNDRFFSSRLQPLEPLELEIQDESGGEESKFMISVVSKSFEGLPLLKRHRSVYGLIADEMKIVHAVTLSTNTPEEVGM